MKRQRAISGPLGYWHHAQSYARAADAAFHEDGAKVMFPVLYLYGIAIELSLKAFLLARGESPTKVAAFGHRLKDLLTQARRRKLGYKVQLIQNDLRAIRLLSQSYAHQPHRLRYFVSGTVQVPPLEVTRHAAHRLLKGLKPFCAEATLGRRNAT
jgi:HEPN domain-containing protein